MENEFCNRYNKAKCWFFKNVYRIDNLLTKGIKKKKKQISSVRNEKVTL